MYPEIKICEACSQTDSCANKLSCLYIFLDWEEYKHLYMPSSQTKRCDIIFSRDDAIFFIELKAKDWFDETKKSSTSGDVLEDIKSDLLKKITSTYDEYNSNIASTQNRRNIFSVIFSKQMSPHWAQDEIPSSLVKEMLRMRVFPKFPDFSYVDHSFSYNNKKIFLDVRECSAIDEMLK